MIIPDRDDRVQEAINQIRVNGFYQDNHFLSLDMLHSIANEVQSALQNGDFEFPCLAQSLIDPKTPTHAKLIEKKFLGHPKDYQKAGIAFDKNDFKSLDQSVRDFRPSTIKVDASPNTPNLIKILLDDFVLRVVEGYMGLRPYLVEAYARRNFPSEFKVMNHYWHRDSNHPFFMLKSFIFLSDCDANNGPHQFLRGSHISEDFREKMYYEDYEVESKHHPQVVTSIVKAGTLILEDTRGLHRACVPTEGTRDLLYGVYLPLPKIRRRKVKYYDYDDFFKKTLSPRQIKYLP